MLNKIWSEEYSSYVSYAFSPVNNIPKKAIKIDIAKCIIKESCFGYFELWLNDKRLKAIKFMEYLKYRDYVKEVIYYE